MGLGRCVDLTFVLNYLLVFIIANCDYLYLFSFSYLDINFLQVNIISKIFLFQASFIAKIMFLDHTIYLICFLYTCESFCWMSTLNSLQRWIFPENLSSWLLYARRDFIITIRTPLTRNLQPPYLAWYVIDFFNDSFRIRKRVEVNSS